jgi:hypothetical protein
LLLIFKPKDAGAPPATFQPLWRLLLAIPGTIEEQDQMRVDYSAALFFNRSEGVVPPVVGTEWIIRARRRRGR